MTPWFRMYNEVLDDPKVQRLSDELFKTWVNFMCLASRFSGHLPPVSDIAFALRISESDAAVRYAQLVDVKLIDDGPKPMMHNWKGRQFHSDSSTSRVKRFRKRSRNGTGNAPEQNRTEQIKPLPLSGFDGFWSVHPRKVGKADAQKAWNRIAPDSSLQEKILAAVEAQKSCEQWRRDNGKYIPHPATWLNRGQWDDEIESAKSPKGFQAVV